ncbi:MAG: 3,4-dihydroxy-2-butanone-4-phosphate synthase [Solirubrobacteraceae bacterium]
MRQLRDGGMIVLYDDQHDQGDLLAAAELTTAQTVTTMVQRGGGLVAVALPAGRIRDLGLKQIPVKREGGRRACERTPTIVSVEARIGVSTGISAEDRARTISALSDPASEGSDLVSPGHVFPLAAADGGLLERYGRLEAATEAVRAAGLEPAATLCDALDDDGDLATAAGLRALALQLGIPSLSIGDLVESLSDELWSNPLQAVTTGAAVAAGARAGATAMPATVLQPRSLR